MILNHSYNNKKIKRMRKNIFILVFSLIPLLSFSQKFNGGILFGFVASQLDGDGHGTYNKGGFMGGGFVNREITEKFKMEMEIKYIQKGSRKEADPENGDLTYYLSRLNYIEVPLLIDYKVSKFDFQLGIAAAVLINAKEDRDGNGLEEADPPFNKTDISGLAGFNYHFLNKLYLNIRVSYSIAPVREHAGGATYYANKGQYNNLLSAGLYYQFNAKK